MPHPLVLQLRFTRSEFQRALKGVTAEEAVQHFGPMNCISWIVGHLAWQEQMYWLTQAQGITPAPEVNACANGQPMTSPVLDEMWAAWKRVTAEVDKFLEPLDSATLVTHTLRLAAPHEPYKESIGTRIRRTTYHYWYHTGESQAIRQLVGHTGLPQFVGDIGDKAPYVPES
ncbi:MAG: DinB family protein [Chloroflexi bacterium]|nr:DinB family protein [Chloroflexota bacterium]